jgi:chitodextrinase
MVDISWTASTDNVAVAGYQVFRNGMQVATTTGITYFDSGLTPATGYLYSVTAFDAAGNISPAATLSVATIPDTTPPSTPTNLVASHVTTSTVSLTWASSTDNVGVAGYQVFRNGTQVGTTTSATAYTDSGLAASTTYSYAVAAYDAAGNISSISTSVNATTLPLSDTTPPTVSITFPANNATVSSTVIVTATASDNVGVTKVQFYLDGTAVAASTIPPYTWTWNTASSTNGTHTLTAAAYDAAGNVGTSTAVTVTVNNPAPPKKVTFVQQAAKAITNSGTSLATSFSSKTTAGDLVIVAFDKSGTQTPTITDTQGNVFAEIGTELVSPGGARARLYYAKNIKGGADTVTVALSKSSNYIEVYLTEYTGANTSTPIDVQAGKTGNTGAVTSGNATTTIANEIIYGWCESDATCSPASGFTTLSTLDGNLVENKAVTSVGSYAATGSSNNGWAMQMAAVRP